MDRRLFCPEPMNLKADIDAKARRGGQQGKAA
jgi:hypothetical protein